MSEAARGRRADVAGISRKREAFAAGPGEASIPRLIGAVLPEADDEWATQHRYMHGKAMAELLGPPLIRGQATLADDAGVTPQAAQPRLPRLTRHFHHVGGRCRGGTTRDRHAAQPHAQTSS